MADQTTKELLLKFRAETGGIKELSTAIKEANDEAQAMLAAQKKILDEAIASSEKLAKAQAKEAKQAAAEDAKQKKELAKQELAEVKEKNKQLAAEAKAQAKEAAQLAKDQAKQISEVAKETNRQAKEQAKAANDELKERNRLLKEQTRQSALEAKEQAKEQSRILKEQAQQAKEDAKIAAQAAKDSLREEIIARREAAREAASIAREQREADKQAAKDRIAQAKQEARELQAAQEAYNRSMMGRLSAAPRYTPQTSMISGMSEAGRQANISAAPTVRQLPSIPPIPQETRSSYDSLFARIGAINIEYRIWNSLINTVSESLRGVPKVGIELDSVKASLEATMGSSAGMVGALEALDIEAQRTGINIGILRDNFKGFQASTSLAGASMSSTWKMFTDMNTVISGLHLSADKANHVFLAMSQIFNKSKVQSEELVKQLGNLLPGAFASFAASMNILPAELSKRMKEGTVYAQDTMENFIAYMANRFAPAFAMSADNLNANVGRMETSFIHLQEAIYASSSGPMNDFVKGATNLTNHITALVNGTEQLSSTFTTGLKVATGLLVLELGSLIVKVGEASTAFKILEGAMAFFGPIRVAIVAAGAALAYFATEATAGSVALDKANESYREMKKLRGEVLQEKVTTDAQLLKITVETDEQVAKATKLLTKHQQEYNDALKASDTDVSVNGMRLITKQETLKNIQKTIEDDNKAIVDAKKSATEKILQAEKDSLARQKEAQTKDMTELSEHYSDMMGRYAKTAEEAGNYAAAKIATSKFKGDKAAYEKIKERFEAPASILTEKENLRPTLEQYNEALKTMAVMDEEVARARQAGIDTFNKKGESEAKKGAAERLKVTKEEINTIKQFETTAANNADNQIKLLDAQNKAKIYSFEEYARRKKEILAKDYEAEKGYNEQQRALAAGTGKKDLVAKYDEKLKQLKSDYESKVGTGDTKGIIDNEAAQNIDAYNTNLNMIHERYQDILGIERDSNAITSAKLELIRQQLVLESTEKGEVGETARQRLIELEVLKEAQNLKAKMVIYDKETATAEKIHGDAISRINQLEQVGQISSLSATMARTKANERLLEIRQKDVDLAKKALDEAKPEARPASQAAYDLAVQKLESLKLVADETGAMIEQSLGNAFDNAFTGLINKSMTASQAFKSFANSVLGDIAKIIAQEMRSQILGSILKPLASAAWGGITSGVSGMFGSAAANTAGTVGGINMNNTSLTNMKLANGGVVTGAGISAHSGTIVSSPTVFPFAKGVGLMGEAGPEAILPLKRNAQGKLGVVTENAGQSKGNLYNITVNVQSKQGENPEQFGQRAAAAMMRSIAKEEISNAKRPGNTLNKARFG